MNFPKKYYFCLIKACQYQKTRHQFLHLLQIYITVQAISHLSLPEVRSANPSFTCQSSLFIWGLKWSATVRLTMADHFAMDGIADYSIISGLQTTYIQRSTMPLNRPICQNGKCKKMKNQLSGLKWTFGTEWAHINHGTISYFLGYFLPLRYK